LFPKDKKDIGVFFAFLVHARAGLHRTHGNRNKTGLFKGLALVAGRHGDERWPV
jgi:hypothetical protein